MKRKPKAGTSKRAAETRLRLFVETYISNGRNATQAAIKTGYSAKTAGQQGARLLKDVKVQELLQTRQEAIANRLEITTERTLLERARLAYYDIGEIAKAGIAGPKDIAKLPEDLRRIITGWKWDKDGRFVLMFADKGEHLTALDKHLGLYDKDNAQKGKAEAEALREFFRSIYGPGNRLPIARQ